MSVLSANEGWSLLAAWRKRVGVPAFHNIGVLAHPLRPATNPLAQDISDSLQANGLVSWMRCAWDAASVQPLMAGTDLMIAIGGDGAMLRAARLCATEGIPLFGINTGHLGFLTEISPEDWVPSLEMLLNREFWIEERMMICCEIRRGSELVAQSDALNDVVISRGAVARSIRLETYIDGGWATTYHCDGLIIATPTGSTAYALAVGGPILPPELKNILVVPVAPHLSMDRPMVLAQGATVQVVIEPQMLSEVVLTLDGELLAHMQEADQCLVKASDKVSRFVRLRDRNYFYRSLLDRLEPRVSRPRPLQENNPNRLGDDD
jgi:NAD+ kinase